LDLRRQLGFKLEREGAQLSSLADYVQEVGHVGPLTIDLMVRWAQSSPQAGAHHQARRLEIARRFAQFWSTFAPGTEVPSPGRLGPSNSVRRAHIYTGSQISDLLHASGELSGPPAGRGLTYQTLFGLLACTGLRISEALQLQVQDLDVPQRLLSLRQTKGGQSRQIVLHASAVQALQRYHEQRSNSGPTSAFFSLRSDSPLHLRSL
jgi:site-specific recombinase XerD